LTHSAYHTAFSVAIAWAHYHFFVQFIVNSNKRTLRYFGETAQKARYHCNAALVHHNIFVQM